MAGVGVGEGEELFDWEGLAVTVADTGVWEGEGVTDSELVLVLEGYTGHAHLAYAAVVTSTGGLLNASSEQVCWWAFFRRLGPLQVLSLYSLCTASPGKSGSVHEKVAQVLLRG